MTLGSGYGEGVLKVQKGILPPSSDTLHSLSCNPDIHTTEDLIYYTNKLKERSCIVAPTSLIALDDCLNVLYIYIYLCSGSMFISP